MAHGTAAPSPPPCVRPAAGAAPALAGSRRRAGEPRASHPGRPREAGGDAALPDPRWASGIHPTPRLRRSGCVPDRPGFPPSSAPAGPAPEPGAPRPRRACSTPGTGRPYRSWRRLGHGSALSGPGRSRGCRRRTDPQRRQPLGLPSAPRLARPWGPAARGAGTRGRGRGRAGQRSAGDGEAQLRSAPCGPSAGALWAPSARRARLRPRRAARPPRSAPPAGPADTLAPRRGRLGSCAVVALGIKRSVFSYPRALNRLQLRAEPQTSALPGSVFFLEVQGAGTA